MRKSYLFCILLCAVSFANITAQTAQQVFDNATAAFEKAGGITVKFNVSISHNGFIQGQENGELSVLKDKVLLNTSNAVTYFDGKTQWTLLPDSDEVTVSEPSGEDELQSINPYALFYIYKNNYSLKMGTLTTYKGKAIYEVILTPTNTDNSMAQLNVYFDKTTYQILFIQVLLRDGTTNDITINGYKTDQKFPDGYFKFDKKKYPNAEIIDLR